MSSLSGWTKTSGVTTVHDGILQRSVIQVEDKSATTAAYAYKDIKAEPGTSHTLNAKVRSVSGPGGQVYLDFLNASRQRISVKTITATNKDWQEKILNGVAPTGTAYVRIWLYVTGLAQGIVQFDNVKLNGQWIDGSNFTDTFSDIMILGAVGAVAYWYFMMR